MKRPGQERRGTVLIANPGADLYGSDRMVLESVAVLHERGYRVVVTTPNDGPLLAEILARGGEVTVCPTPVIRKSMLRPLGFLRLGLEVARSVRPSLSVLRRVAPEVVYVNTITPPLWLLLAKLTRLPSVCHVHEGEASVPLLLRRAINLPLLLADRLIVNSEFSLGVLAGALSMLAGRSEVLYNAVAGPAQPVPARERLDGRLRLLYVGRLSPRKGPNVAIEAVSLLRAQNVPATLDLVGAVFPGYEWFERDLIEQVRQASLEDVVCFHGFQRDTWAFAAAADVVLVPSAVDEPFGNTAVEALLAARPVVVSDVGGLPEAAAGFGAAVIVAPGDPQALAAAVEQIAAHWHDFRAAAISDAAAARMQYSTERYGARLVTILEQVMGAGRRTVRSASRRPRLPLPGRVDLAPGAGLRS